MVVCGSYLRQLRLRLRCPIFAIIVADGKRFWSTSAALPRPATLTNAEFGVSRGVPPNIYTSIHVRAPEHTTPGAALTSPARMGARLYQPGTNLIGMRSVTLAAHRRIKTARADDPELFHYPIVRRSRLVGYDRFKESEPPATRRVDFSCRRLRVRGAGHGGRADNTEEGGRLGPKPHMRLDADVAGRR